MVESAPPLDSKLVRDAQFALEAYLPDAAEHADAAAFLEETRLGDDPAFITELAAMGKPRRQLLAKARDARTALATVNEGTREHARPSEALRGLYQNIYGDA